MIRFESAQTIGRSADDIWAYAADMRRHPEWMDVTDSRVVRGAGSEVGARGLQHIKLGPRSYEVELEVSGSIPARRIAWRLGAGSPLAGHVTLDLEPLGPGRTRATWSGWLGLRGLWRVLEPLMAREVRAGEAAELRHLKENLESRPAGFGQPGESEAS